MEIKINEEKCLGCGACASICPEIFEVENGKAKVRKKDADDSCANEAKDTCPVQAIQVS